ncbi:MAG: hypothetical protein ACYDBB_14120 [Armatimonadota bacterium]
MAFNELTELEQQAIDLLLAGDDPVLSVLRAQVKHLCILSREFTGVGLYVNFHFLEDIERVSGKQDFCIHDVCGELPNVEHGVAFNLFIHEGALATLEGYTYDDYWPDEFHIHGFQLSYCGGQRDLEEVRKGWSV